VAQQCHQRLWYSLIKTYFISISVAIGVSSYLSDSPPYLSRYFICIILFD